MKKIIGIILAISLFIVPSMVYASSDIKIDRIYGYSRYGTNIKILDGYNYGNSSILTTGEKFPDALAGTSLKMPVVLIKNSLTNEIFNKLNDNVYILGSKYVISKEIEKELKDRGKNVIRLSGKTRYDTSVEISKLNNYKDIIVVNGEAYPDAISAVNLMLNKNYGVILIKKGSIPYSVEKYLSKLKPNSIVILGSEYVINKNIENKLKKLSKNVTRIEGNNRYLTNLKVIETVNRKNIGDSIIVTTGNNWPDALSIVNLAVKNKSLLYITNNRLSSEQVKKIESDKNKIKSIKILGSTIAVKNYVREQLEFYLKITHKYKIRLTDEYIESIRNFSTNMEAYNKLKSINSKLLEMNKYRYISTKDDNKIYNIKHLPYDVRLELTDIAKEYINSMRIQIGEEESFITRDSLEFSKKVTEEYIKDKWNMDNVSLNGYNGMAIKRVALSYGLPNPSDREAKSGTQYYESIFYIGRGRDKYTKKELKRLVYSAILDIVFNGGRWEQAKSLLGLQINNNDKDYIGVSFSNSLKEGADYTAVHIHFIHDKFLKLKPNNTFNSKIIK